MKRAMAVLMLLVLPMAVACEDDSPESEGAGEVEAADPKAVSAEIKNLLDEIVKTYEDGDPDAAAELAAEAYLENYEEIEDAVAEAAPEVNEELEGLLGTQLRERIADGAPVEEIERMVERANELLDEAVAAVDTGE